jgi:hypothetical protein
MSQMLQKFSYFFGLIPEKKVIWLHTDNPYTLHFAQKKATQWIAFLTKIDFVIIFESQFFLG